MNRPRVQFFAQFYDPAYKAGGPVPAIRALVAELKDATVRVLAGDRDLGEVEPYRMESRVRNSPGFSIHYQPPLKPSTIAGYLRQLQIATAADVLVVNSVFSTAFSILPILFAQVARYAGHVVIFPRGELASSGLILGRAWAKTLWLRLMKYSGMHDVIGRAPVTWVASSAHEAVDIATQFPGAAITVMPEVLQLPVGPPRHFRKAQPRKVVTVGRIAPVKGTLDLLQGLREVQTPLTLDVIGPPEDANYVENCRKAVNALPRHIEVHWRGALPPTEIEGIVSSADLFVLLTKGENFGHAIAEALALGTPVLIGARTPWADAAKVAGAVLAEADREDAVRVGQQIDCLLAVNPQEWTSLSRAAQAAITTMPAPLPFSDIIDSILKDA